MSADALHGDITTRALDYSIVRTTGKLVCQPSTHMGAFIGYGHTGVWANNRERDAFLDWYAAHRCRPYDERWEYCKSEAQRWTGRCIELNDLIPQGELFEISDEERTCAATDFWPHVAQLLGLSAGLPEENGIIRSAAKKRLIGGRTDPGTMASRPRPGRPPIICDASCETSLTKSSQRTGMRMLWPVDA